MVIHPADVADEIRGAGKFDIQTDTNISVNFEKLITRISQTVDKDSSRIAAGYLRRPGVCDILRMGLRAL